MRSNFLSQHPFNQLAPSEIVLLWIPNVKKENLGQGLQGATENCSPYGRKENVHFEQGLDGPTRGALSLEVVFVEGGDVASSEVIFVEGDDVARLGVSLVVGGDVFEGKERGDVSSVGEKRLDALFEIGEVSLIVTVESER